MLINRPLTFRINYSTIRAHKALFCPPIASEKRALCVAREHYITKRQERRLSFTRILDSSVADEQRETSMEEDQKNAREQEKERKKAEKLKKLEDKKSKKSTTTPVAVREKSNTKATLQKPTYVDATPEGEKKMQGALDNEGLKAYDPTVVEAAHYAWWEKMGFFRPEFGADEKTKLAESFVIIEPPPNVTGLLHMGHALSGTLQDIMIR
jgi:hypothetical protein